MFRGFILFLSFTLAVSAGAQTLQETLRSTVAAQELSRQQSLLLQVRQVLDPLSLPGHLQDPERLPVKSATDLAFQIESFRNDPELSADPLARTFLYRPERQTSLVSPSGFFRIHYDTAGSHGVDPRDDDNSGFPDYTEEVAAAFDLSYTVMITEMGMQPPPSDRGRDGSEYDVYIRNIQGAYGWTNFEEELEGARWISYIEMDNDYQHTPTRGLDAARVTAAHEFFHAVQLGYIGRDDDGDGGLDDVFLMEAGSTWMEDVVYDDVNDYLYYLNGFFDVDNRPFNYNYGLHMYGLCVWFHFLEQRLGSRDFAREFWEELVLQPGMPAMADVLSRQGKDLAQELTLFRGWNFKTAYRADQERYYPEGASYPLVRMAGTHQVSGDSVLTADVRYCTARYYRFVNALGDTAVIVPAHTGWFDSPDQHLQVAVHVAAGASEPGYYYLGNSFNTRLEGDDNDVWAGIGISWQAGSFPLDITPFAAGIAPIVTDNVPAVYPNPFRPKEHASVAVRVKGITNRESIALRIYTASGRLLLNRRLVLTLEQSVTTFDWDGRDENGREMPSGVYLAVVTNGGRVAAREKLLLIR